jgi:hypothetical protein
VSARVWVLRREAKRFRRLCAVEPPMGRAFWATGRRLLDAADELERLIRLGRRSRYANRRLDVWLAS